MSWKRILREPLLHFLLIGLMLFLLYGQASPGGSESRRIVVSQAQVDAMVRDFRGSRNRLPTAAELSALIDSEVRDEIIYREGRSLGLDQDDAVIKRRVRQKYDLIAEEQDRAEPTDEQLLEYLNAHPESFRTPAVVDFEQIYFDPTSSNPQKLFAAKAALANGRRPAEFGDPSMLPARVANSSIDLIANDFGDKFADQLAAIPVGQWLGPFGSSLGVHLVRVNSRSAATLPPLDDVKAEVLREWENDRRTRSREDDYRKLRDGYDVVVEANLTPATAP